MKIKVEKLRKDFKNNTVLNNITLNFESGKIYGLCGRNGSGKTVFLKLLCGLYMPSSGHVLYDDEEITLDNNYKFKIGALIENPKFFNDLSGYDNLKVLADIRKEIGKTEILDSLKDVNLLPEKDKKFGKYSLGMKQKLGIAQVLMENPNVLILDEPFNGIENMTVKKIKKILLENKKNKKIIIISSHIKEDLNELCDQIFYFDNGNVFFNEKDIDE